MYNALCIIMPMFFRKYISSSSKNKTGAALLILHASQQKCMVSICFKISEVNPYYIEPRNKWVSRMEICTLYIHLGYMGKIFV